MPIKNSHDMNVLKIQNGGGCLMLFGLPFFLGGLATILAKAGVLKMEGDMPWMVAILVGGLFTAVGSLFMFGRTGITFDKHRKAIISWKGLLFPMWTKSLDFGQFEHVYLTKEIRRSDKSTYTVYPVRLEGDETLDLEEPRDYMKSRTMAERVAKFMDCPLHDNSTGTLRVREQGTLDESLRERYRRTGQSPAIPPKPSTMKAQVNSRRGEVEIHIPKPPFAFIHFFAFVPFLIFAVIFFVMFGDVITSDDHVGRYIFLGFFGFVAVMMIFGAIRSAGGGTIGGKAVDVVANSRHLRLVAKGMLGAKTIELPAGEVEEMYVGGRPLSEIDSQEAVPEVVKTLAKRFGNRAPIVACSDKRIVEFATHLPHAESGYLAALIATALAGLELPQ